MEAVSSMKSVRMLPRMAVIGRWCKNLISNYRHRFADRLSAKIRPAGVRQQTPWGKLGTANVPKDSGRGSGLVAEAPQDDEQQDVREVGEEVGGS